VSLRRRSGIIVAVLGDARISVATGVLINRGSIVEADSIDGSRHAKRGRIGNLGNITRVEDAKLSGIGSTVRRAGLRGAGTVANAFLVDFGAAEVGRGLINI